MTPANRFCPRCGVTLAPSTGRCASCGVGRARWGRRLGYGLLSLLLLWVTLWAAEELTRKTQVVSFFEPFKVGDHIEVEVTAVRGTSDGFFLVEYETKNDAELPIEPIPAFFSMRSAGGTPLYWDPLCSIKPEIARESVHARDIPPGKRVASATCFFRDGEVVEGDRDDYLLVIDQKYSPPTLLGKFRAVLGASFGAGVRR